MPNKVAAFSAEEREAIRAIAIRVVEQSGLNWQKHIGLVNEIAQCIKRERAAGGGANERASSPRHLTPPPSQDTGAGAVKQRGDVFLRHLYNMLETEEDRAIVREALRFSTAVNGDASVYAAFMAAMTFVKGEYEALLKKQGILVAPQGGEGARR